jgi:hypothetical protein
MDAKPLTDAHGKPLPDAKPVGVSDGEGTLEDVADEVGV